jgi:DNA polymerase-3 subunit beta
MVTADAYRMAVAEKRIERTLTRNINIFVSLKTMKMMQKLIKKDLVIRYDTKKIILKQENITFSARLMDVNFPNYKAVLPNNFATEIKVNRKELTDAIKLISVIAKNQGDTVKIDIKNNVMIASARSADRGDGEVSIEIEHEGGDIVVAFDPAFILDVLKSLDEKEVSMKFVDAENALQMQSSDEVLYIVMPVKMRE